MMNRLTSVSQHSGGASRVGTRSDERKGAMWAGTEDKWWTDDKDLRFESFVFVLPDDSVLLGRRDASRPLALHGLPSSEYVTVSPVTPVEDPLRHQDYRDALNELERLREVAAEEGYPEPSEEISSAARKLLRQMFRLAPFPYDVSPEDDGGISIHAISNEVYVFVVLSPDGRDRCFINMDGESRRSVYTDRSKVFGRFLKGALRDLADLAGRGNK